MRIIWIAIGFGLFTIIGCTGGAPGESAITEYAEGIDIVLHPNLAGIIDGYEATVEWSDSRENYFVVFNYLLSQQYAATFTDHPEIFAFKLVDTGIEGDGRNHMFVEAMGSETYNYKRIELVEWWGATLENSADVEQFQEMVGESTYYSGQVSFNLGFLNVKRTSKVFIATLEGLKQ